MSDLSLAVQVDLALVLGLVAVIVTLVVWRVSGSRAVTEALHSSLRRLRTGYASRRTFWSASLRVLQVATESVGLAICLWASYLTLRYFDLVGRVTRSSLTRDYGLHIQLMEDATGLKDSIVIATTWITLFLIVGASMGWFAALRERGLEAIVEGASHPRVIPKRWRSSVPALWQRRVEWAMDRDPGSGHDHDAARFEGRRWREDWSTWARGVALFERVAASEVVEKRKPPNSGAMFDSVL